MGVAGPLSVGVAQAPVNDNHVLRLLRMVLDERGVRFGAGAFPVLYLFRTVGRQCPTEITPMRPTPHETLCEAAWGETVPDGVVLGESREEFRVSFGTLLMHLLLLVVVAGITGYAFYNWAPGLAAGPEALDLLKQVVGGGMLVSLTVYSAITLRRYYRGRHLRFRIYEEGFECARAGRLTACRWDDVAAVRDGHARANNAFRWIHIRSRHGAEWRFDQRTDLLDDFPRLIEVIHREVGRHRLAGALGQLDAGQAVDFGAVRVTPEGLECSGETLPWLRVGKGRLTEFALSIFEPGARFAWRNVPTADLVNRGLLVALWNETERRRAPQDSHG